MTAIEPPERRVGPHPLGKERIDRLAEFESSWKPPVLLRKHHKSAIKNYYSLKQGRDGSRALCCFCNVEFGVLQLQIHHDDHDRTNNQLSNVMPACEPCNNEERATWLAASYAARCAVSTPRERENTTNDANAQLGQNERQQRKMRELAPTTQLSKQYKVQVWKHLINHVSGEGTPFDTIVADLVILVGCSREKAEQYLIDDSESHYAPYLQYSKANRTWIKPRESWNIKYANEEYRKALAEIEREKRAGASA